MDNLMVFLMFVLCFWGGWTVKRIIDEPEDCRLSSQEIYEERTTEDERE